ncbi:hypothetical protein Csa_012370 [Cucumis sativus]|uniref:Uncharacterized protein n=1 Tax=Cucumis sativus TaxID=3659 RepID=A0A0A0KYL8_CUCSA|nr:hypothetical protein Csa_012370 [Cucumis sativus]
MNKKRFEKVSPLPNAPPPSEFGGRTTEEAKQGRKEGEEAIMTYGDGSLRRQPNGHQLSSLSLLSVCLTPLPLPPHSSIPSCFQTLTSGDLFMHQYCMNYDVSYPSPKNEKSQGRASSGSGGVTNYKSTTCVIL